MLSSEEQQAWAERMDAEGRPGEEKDVMTPAEALSAARYELLLLQYDVRYAKGAAMVDSLSG